MTDAPMADLYAKRELHSKVGLLLFAIFMAWITYEPSLESMQIDWVFSHVGVRIVTLILIAIAYCLLDESRPQRYVEMYLRDFCSRHSKRHDEALFAVLFAPIAILAAIGLCFAIMMTIWSCSIPTIIYCIAMIIKWRSRLKRSKAESQL